MTPPAVQDAMVQVVCPSCLTANRVPQALPAGRPVELREASFAARLGIRGIPTLILFRAGREVNRVSGALDKRSLVQWLNTASSESQCESR